MKYKILKILSYSNFSDVYNEPPNPSNETLKMWKEKNVTAHDISWGNLTVSVSTL